jgi:hypothetical protein
VINGSGQEKERVVSVVVKEGIDKRLRPEEIKNRRFS